MKHYLRILPAVLLAVSLIACSAPAAAEPPAIPTLLPTLEPAATITPPAEPTAVSAVVTFTDPALEAMVRGAIGKPEGDITAAEAQAVTRLNLSNELEQTLSGAAPIQEISGLENFTGLEYLDLSSHAISDISPLAGLAKLTLLSLDGNPVADLAPLAGLTSLKGLSLSNCAAQDYSPLAALVNLEFLRLENAMITDLLPLAALTNLKHLYLAGSPVSDYSLLADLYPNLVDKDFTIVSTLQELGFDYSNEVHMAKFANESLDVIIHHAEWGPPSFEWDENIIRVSMVLEGGYQLSVGYYGVHKVYVCQMHKDGEQLMNYIYDPNDSSNNPDSANRPSVEQAIRAAMDVMEGEDVLFAPVRIFDETLKNTFNMTPEKLFALPFAPPTLTNLGFFPDEANAVWRYEQRDGNDVNLEIHRPEWGELDYDFLFFTELSADYRIVITYHSAERSFVVGADDNDQGGADFEFFFDTQEHIDGWCSNADLTVEDYFINAFNDPAIEDIYAHSIDLVMQYIADRFGMTFEELLALPAGE